jgi:hypothetical protein
MIKYGHRHTCLLIEMLSNHRKSSAMIGRGSKHFFSWACMCHKFLTKPFTSTPAAATRDPGPGSVTVPGVPIFMFHTCTQFMKPHSSPKHSMLNYTPVGNSSGSTGRLRLRSDCRSGGTQAGRSHRDGHGARQWPSARRPGRRTARKRLGPGPGPAAAAAGVRRGAGLGVKACPRRARQYRASDQSHGSDSESARALEPSLGHATVTRSRSPHHHDSGSTSLRP